jgi:hypothetical protein
MALQIREIDRRSALEGFPYSGGQNEETALYGLLNGFCGSFSQARTAQPTLLPIYGG